MSVVLSGKSRRADNQRSSVGLMSISHRNFGLVQNGDIGRANREIEARHRAAQHVRHEHLCLTAVVVDRQIPWAVEKDAVIQDLDQLAVAIDDLQRTQRYRIYSAVRRGHVADKDKPSLQYTERRV